MKALYHSYAHQFSKGATNFEEIRTNGYLYINKTKYIELLEYIDSTSVHLLRPKRFGKSLFTSMLQCYYDPKMNDVFDKLLKGTYIRQHHTEKKTILYLKVLGNPPDLNVALSLFNLIEILRNKIKDSCLYVLIDEYDHFANDFF